MIPTTTNNRGFWTWIPIATQIPPSMTIPEKDKENESYHALWTRYFLSRQVGAWIEYYRGNYSANMDYAIDSRWGEEEDVRMFLGDGPSQTSRIPFKFPIVYPPRGCVLEGYADERGRWRWANDGHSNGKAGGVPLAGGDREDIRHDLSGPHHPWRQ